MNTDNPPYLNERKDKSFSKDLIAQMKDKIKRKQRNHDRFDLGELSRILVLPPGNVDESYKNTEYHDFGNKQDKKVSSLGRSPPNKKKHKMIKKVRVRRIIILDAV